jgi:hypothetical protein
MEHHCLWCEGVHLVHWRGLGRALPKGLMEDIACGLLLPVAMLEALDDLQQQAQ